MRKGPVSKCGRLRGVKFWANIYLPKKRPDFKYSCAVGAVTDTAKTGWHVSAPLILVANQGVLKLSLKEGIKKRKAK